MLSFV
ncbi:hypothetical protein H206_03066 [Candidatus Electrothrix aarhusensis]|jgi:hypothetical protein